MTDNDTRRGVFLRTLDGDTFAAYVILHGRIKPEPMIRTHVRVAGWSAQELRETEGPAMRDAFDALLRAATRIDLQIIGMSFERVVAYVFLDGVRFDGLLVNTLHAIRLEHAKHS